MNSARRTGQERLHRCCWGSSLRSGEEYSPASKTSISNSFALVSFDEMTQAVEAQRRAAAEKLEAERRAGSGNGNCPAGAGPALPPELSSPENPRLCRASAFRRARWAAITTTSSISGRNGWRMVLGDISGKGIAGALLMANLQANLRSQCAIAVDELQRLLRSVNQLFYDNTARQCLCHAFLRRISRPGATPALRQLRASLRLSCFAAMTPWSGWTPRQRCSDSSSNGIARSGSASSCPAT